MELDERPTEQYSDIGGLDTQIQEVLLRAYNVDVYCMIGIISGILFKQSKTSSNIVVFLANRSCCSSTNSQRSF